MVVVGALVDIYTMREGRTLKGAPQKFGEGRLGQFRDGKRATAGAPPVVVRSPSGFRGARSAVAAAA
ncbi:hypothetical protein [Sinomonas sp. R1AF57]|uniref:hypothetical protein n=1 Tax=Sinomonas sp. R1AF57 TaxID=2020377 RepID=UPI001ABF7C88|nr:hypothetical protein [Sinomonas sp. R1AF57]